MEKQFFSSPFTSARFAEDHLFTLPIAFNPVKSNIIPPCCALLLQLEVTPFLLSGCSALASELLCSSSPNYRNLWSIQVQGTLNVADALTKSLPAQAFHQHQEYLWGSSVPFSSFKYPGSMGEPLRLESHGVFQD
eukprot:3941012-Rhodomonas_salina.1